VRARHQGATEAIEVVREKKFDLGRAILTGGLIMRKTEKREVTSRTEASEQVLYLFRSSRGVPWLLREHDAHYDALGAAVAPTTSRNFATAVEQFRARAPHARFDDSLLRRPKVADVDLYAHLIATADASP